MINITNIKETKQTETTFEELEVGIALCSCHEFTQTVYIKGRRHCAICGKLENEPDLAFSY